MPGRANLPPAAALICLFTHAHAAPVTPPKIPQMNSEYVDESKLVAFKQSPALAAELDALGKGSIKEIKLPYNFDITSRPVHEMRTLRVQAMD